MNIFVFIHSFINSLRSGPRGGGWRKEWIGRDSEGTEGQGEEGRGLGRRGGLGRRERKGGPATKAHVFASRPLINIHDSVDCQIKHVKHQPIKFDYVDTFTSVLELSKL
jgi:hypothetical protein